MAGPARPQARGMRSARAGWLDGQLQALKVQLDCGRSGARRLSRRRARRARSEPTAPIRPRSPGLTPSWWPPWWRAPARRRRSAGCGGWSRPATSSAVAGRARQLGHARQSDGAQGRAAAARGRAGRPVWRAPPARSRTSAREKAKLDGRIREERRALLRQFEGEVARARAGEQALAEQLAELKGKALRREATPERTQELEREVELKRRLYESYLARASSEGGASGGRSRMRG